MAGGRFLRFPLDQIRLLHSQGDGLRMSDRRRAAAGRRHSNRIGPGRCARAAPNIATTGAIAL